MQYGTHAIIFNTASVHAELHAQYISGTLRTFPYDTFVHSIDTAPFHAQVFPSDSS